MSDRPEIRLDQPVPPQFIVGSGQYQRFEGEITCSADEISSIRLVSEVGRSGHVELFPSEEKQTLEFVASIGWRSGDIGTRQTLEMTLFMDDQTTVSSELGELELVDRPSYLVQEGPKIGDKPLVAICMAIYQADSKRLRRQLESILCQSYENWLLIICDDHSQPGNTGYWEEIEALCALDPRRIRLYRHHQNLGFYHNFERAIAYIPGNAELVAFADQDDEWYPEKLQMLAAKLAQDPEAMLVYSDMRVVSAVGDVVSDTYWNKRNNEYRDFSSVLVRNTVTGAASLFRRELLELALPFPVRVGEAFHDHWIACCAMVQGKLAYISEPLYDYYQYDDSVIGHCDPETRSVAARAISTRQNLPGQEDGNRWQTFYRQDYSRLKLLLETLKLRIPGKAGSFSLNLLNGGSLSILKLSMLWCKARLTGRTNNDAELVLMMSQLKGSKPG